MWCARALRAAGLALALTALGGCTLTPVYGDPAADARFSLAYAEPDTRLEQIVYQTLSQRLGADQPGAPEFSASVAISAKRLGLSEVPSPVADHQVTATISYTVSRDDMVLASGSRSATALYQTTGQIVADQTARSGAEEQATRAAAETVRLALMAALATQ